MTWRPVTAPADVLIVGSGIMGASVARLVRESMPGAHIVMVDAGLPIGDAPGVHLHEMKDPDLWNLYNEKVSSGIQGLYTGASTATGDVSSMGELSAGLHLVSALGNSADEMPLAAVAWNAGGMGAHWTAAVPTPFGDEIYHHGDRDRFAAELRTAQRVLTSLTPAIGPTAIGAHVLDELRGLYPLPSHPDRRAQPMPMAVQPRADGWLRRTAPGSIFPPLARGGDERFTPVLGALARSIDHDGARAGGVGVERVATGESAFIRSRVTVVCADVLRTPQLLHASGIRPSALGRYLNEHAYVTGRVLLDAGRIGVSVADLPLARPGEFATDSLWLPYAGAAQPYHGQIMNRTFVDDDGSPLAHAVGITLYSGVASRPENRLRFVDGETDATGMPRFDIEFAYTDDDRALIDEAEAEIERIARRFGDFDPATESRRLAPGTSLHQTGTARMGLVDDGSSVCDIETRVWGFGNLLLAGNAVVPTALRANSTLTGAVSAVRAARAAVRSLLSDE